MVSFGACGSHNCGHSMRVISLWLYPPCARISYNSPLMSSIRSSSWIKLTDSSFRMIDWIPISVARSTSERVSNVGPSGALTTMVIVGTSAGVVDASWPLVPADSE